MAFNASFRNRRIDGGVLTERLFSVVTDELLAGYSAFLVGSGRAAVVAWKVESSVDSSPNDQPVPAGYPSEVDGLKVVALSTKEFDVTNEGSLLSTGRALVRKLVSSGTNQAKAETNSNDIADDASPNHGYSTQQETPDDASPNHGYSTQKSTAPTTEQGLVAVSFTQLNEE